jgi:hypothetical protein
MRWYSMGDMNGSVFCGKYESVCVLWADMNGCLFCWRVLMGLLPWAGMNGPAMGGFEWVGVPGGV